jgi:hypothetical protein
MRTKDLISYGIKLATQEETDKPIVYNQEIVGGEQTLI